MLHDPELLLYDEPTSGLDPESSVAVLDLIHEMAGEGRTVIMCTHLLLEAEGLADQVVVLEGGRDVIAGPPAELTRRYWPDTIVKIAATDPSSLLALRGKPGVLGVDLHDGGPATVRLDDIARVPDLVDVLVATGTRVDATSSHSRRRSKISTSRFGGCGNELVQSEDHRAHRPEAARSGP